MSLPVGDGTRASEVGYTLAGLRLPDEAGKPGQLRFVIRNYEGAPQTGFLVEQTKRMHVYVVRGDLAVFRHVHPTMSKDGTWVGNLTLPKPGEYRVVTEFVARDEGGNGDHIILGDTLTVPGVWQPQPVGEPVAEVENLGVSARVLGEVPKAGTEGILEIGIGGARGAPVRLGNYLGTSAHLTGFHVQSGAVVHMHPMGEPVDEGGLSRLSFHAELPQPGDYRLFLQVRVDGFLHTLPLTVTAGSASAG